MASSVPLDVTGGEDGFKAALKESARAGLCVAHFWAAWAEQCQPMDEAIHIMAKEEEFSSVRFLRVSAEDEAEVSMSLEVVAVPTVVFFGPNPDRKGAYKMLDRLEGAKVADLTRKVKELTKRVALDLKSQSLRAAAGNREDPEGEVGTKEETKQELVDRIKKTINMAEAVLFMKGSPDAPECGFSRTTVALLGKYNTEYAFFDIHKDNAVRQGLKEYSNWPTYPQLYVKGELIGGLDILKEMDESGDLEEILPKKVALEDRLKLLVKQADVMVFMKGNPSEPRCGFSRQLMDILTPLDIPFQTFDILQDEEVRQGLKKFSDWPTFPQVYVKGEFVGGLDIVKELREGGELISTLKGE